MFSRTASGEQIEIVARSAAMQALLENLAKVADLDVPILFVGESGAGKRVLGRALHGASRRRQRPLVRIDCRTLAEDSTEVGRTLQRKLTEALGGTLLVEEVERLPERAQLALAHRLELYVPVRRKGGVRALATVHADPVRVERSSGFPFRDALDLLEIEVPPLRVRKEDILPLARSFLARFALPGRLPLELSPELEAALLDHGWPGNVRELRNAMQRATILGPRVILERLSRGDEGRPASALHGGELSPERG